jgi:TonB-linked SusC/RagA family outer membrane protein
MSKIKHITFVFFLLCSGALMAQKSIVTGTVTGADKLPVAGATVAQKGTNNAAVTNDQGTFTLNVSGKNFVLVFSTVGFTSKEVALAEGVTTVSVELTPDKKEMGEVVVTALGIKREKRSLAYATQQVTGEKLGEAREVNVINGLQGKIAGVTITKNASGPGSSSKVILRGSRSIDGNNQPLYVIDGVPLDNSSRSQASNTFGSRDGGDGIGMINPDEIETMQVLKGAAAAALYGSSGQNGAIIITTKRGKSGKIAIDYNGGVMLDKVSVLPELQYDYAQGDGGVYSRNSESSWGPKNSGQKDTLWDGSILALAGQKNRLKDFFRTGSTLTNSISATGGNDKMQTYFFYGNTRANGILNNHDLNRHNITLKLSNSLSTKFTIETKLSYIFEDVNNKPFVGEAPNSVISLYRSPVSIPISNMQVSDRLGVDGEPVQNYWRPNSSTLGNPYWIMNRGSFYERKERVLGFISAKYQFNNSLNFLVRGSMDKTIESTEEKIFNTSYYSQAGSDYKTYNASHNGTNVDALLNYKYTINKNLLISGNVGGSVQQGAYNALIVNANGLNKQNLFVMGNSKTPTTFSGSGLGPQVQSLYGTANVAFRNYLFLDVTARNDWSSALPKSNWSYFYPSVGLTAIISDMVSMPSWISYGKLRAAYAGSGNGGGAYLTKNYYSILSGGRPQAPSVAANEEFKPELTASWEFGIDWKFFNNRLGVDITLYSSETKNQLLRVQTPQASLFASKYINAGLIRNKGIELLLTGTPIKTNNFSWDIALNYAKNKNSVVRLSPNLTETIIVDDRDANIVVKEGGSFGDMYVQGWKRDSLGRRLVDKDGKVIKTSGKSVLLGNYNPDWSMGINNTLSYKGISFSFLIDYRKGGYVISGTQGLIDGDGHSKRSLEGRDGIVLDAYKEDGTKNTTSIKGSEYWSAIGGKYPVGELYAYSATNIRLREVVLGYQLPPRIVNKTGFIKSVKVSLVGRNLFFFKKDAPYDPEIAVGTGNGGGLEYGSLPSTRSMGINLKLSF